MYRWTLAKPFGCKIMLHHFLPNGDDPEPHDHPFDFVTLVLAGAYVDEKTIKPAPGHWCRRCGEAIPDPDCLECRGTGVTQPVLCFESMTRGKVRFRRAEHMHRTLIRSDGCWTIIVTGPKRREWGFIWRGVWMPMQKYLDERGEAAIRCDR